MKQEPSIQNSTQTLYSVIPLALDYSKSNYHQKYIDTPSSDCVLLSKDEVPCTKLRFRNNTISLLQEAKAGGKASKFNLPFTFLLAGPSYTCQSLLNNYLRWPVLHYNSYSSSSIRFSKSNKKIQSAQGPKVWEKLSFPKVWALATLSHVEISCIQGIELQRELRKIFSYPITVHSVAPTNSETHNELLAWIFAIFALSTARKIFRTVLCHYSSLESQQHVWIKNNAETQTSWDLLYNKTAITNKSLCTITHRGTRISQSDPQQATEKKVLELSDYESKKYIYSRLQRHLQRRYIGFSSKQHKFQYLVRGQVRKQQKQLLTLHYSNSHITLQIPLVPYIHTLQNIKNILAYIFEVEKGKIVIQGLQTSLDPLDFHLDNSSVLTNLVLNAAENLQKKREQKADTEHMYILNTKQLHSMSIPCSIAATIELDIKQYSKKIVLKKIHLAIQLDALFHTQRIIAILEHELHTALFSLLGSDCLPLNTYNYFEIHLLEGKQEKNNNQHYYINPVDQVHFVVYKALLDAFGKRKNKNISFPIAEIGD